MNLLSLTTTAVDINAQVAPFQPNNTVLALAAAAITLEDSDDNVTYADFVVLASGIFKKVTLEKQYLRVKTSGVAQLIGN
jgi:hypothetical protein